MAHDNTINPLPDASADDAFAKQLKEGFDAIELSSAAEQRILEQLRSYEADQQDWEDASTQAHDAGMQGVGTRYRDQAAAGRTIGTSTARDTGADSPHAQAKQDVSPGGTQTGIASKRTRTLPWKVILPAAACLLLAAGVGLLVAANETPLSPTTTLEQTANLEPLATTDQSPSETSDEVFADIDDYESDAAIESDTAIVSSFAYDYYQTEEYNDINEPGFIATATRPLSTFSADIDTASYANLRRLINQGYGYADVYDDTPSSAITYEDEDVAYTEYYDPNYPNGAIPKGAIRIEEMLNYFTYDYAQPTGDNLFGTTVHLGDCPWNADTKLLVMGFATRAEQAPAVAGRNLVFLIDTSGSMDEPNKINLLQDAFNQLTSQLDANDRISIVTYAGYEEVVLDGVSGSDARTIQRAIDRLRPEGSTNGEAGLAMAYEVAERHFIEGGVNRIIMASDGDLNVGMSSESELHDFVESKRDSGVYLSVLGFGEGNYKDNKMEVLADAGNGNYHYIDCLEEAEKVFGSDLTANLVPLANDVKLQVEFNPAQVKGYRLIGYENRVLDDGDFRNDAQDAGDVGPGHQITVAYEIVPVDSKMEVQAADLKYGQAAQGDASSSEWLTCTMRYTPVQRAQGDRFVVEASAPREQTVTVEQADLTADPGNDWRFAASVIEFGMVMRDSEYKGTASFSSIEDLLSKVDLTSAERKDFQRLVRKASA